MLLRHDIEQISVSVSHNIQDFIHRRQMYMKLDDCNAGSRANVCTRLINGVNIGVSGQYMRIVEEAEEKTVFRPMTEQDAENLPDRNDEELEQDMLPYGLSSPAMTTGPILSSDTACHNIVSPTAAEPPAHLRASQEGQEDSEDEGNVDNDSEDEPVHIPCGFAHVLRTPEVYS
jgi:hypothetical protein